MQDKTDISPYVGLGHENDGAGHLQEARLKELADLYKAPLERFFIKRVHNPTDVDDLVQEVFCRLAARVGKDIDNPEGYLFQMAANILRDRARRDMVRHVSDHETFEEENHGKEALSPERVMAGRQRIDALKMALKELPERTRAIFLLHRFEELQYVEIARRLGISKSSVEKHMMKAISHVAFRVGAD